MEPTKSEKGILNPLNDQKKEKEGKSKMFHDPIIGNPIKKRHLW